MSVAFDTLKFVEKLEAGGFTHEQAKAAAEAFAEATSQELATKSDLLVIRSDISAVRGGMRELELRMTVKLGGLTIGATGVLIAAMRYFTGGH
ncbi:CCDC90 family protein [Methylosinus sp. Sm6]|uniref:CCDC90 family protein n=1 Tax=Methylosinus sp. Sm6 TaxID=2866948 RepID=UPI001C9947B1|nr:CCDC90 family protein [Methylosinus sp. Sm6]MBY6243703.1 CCDC90 family protein [Methylosinus sp. Sm6]